MKIVNPHNEKGNSWAKVYDLYHLGDVILWSLDSFHCNLCGGQIVARWPCTCQREFPHLHFE